MEENWENQPRCEELSSSSSESESEDHSEIPPPLNDANPDGLPEAAEEEPEEILSPEVLAEMLKRAEQHKVDGNAQFNQKNYIEATFCYTNGLDALPKKHPMAAVFLSNRAACHQIEGDHKQVIEDCTKAIEIDPQYVKAYFRRGTSHQKLKDYRSALADFKKVDELDQQPPIRGIKETIKELTPLAEKQQEEETAKMMGDLKELGNKFLGLFGLSTDNFQMTPDGKGGQTIQFNQNP